MRPDMVKRPMFLGAFASVSAVVFCVYGEVSALVAAFVLSVVLTGLIFNYKKYLTIVLPAILLIATVVSLFGTVKQQNKLETAVSRRDTVTITVMDEPSYDTSRIQFKGKVNKSKILPEGLTVLVYGANNDISVGDIVNTEVSLSSVYNGKDDIYYLSQDIYAELEIKSGLEIEGYSVFYRFLGKVRSFIKDTLYSNLKSSNASTLSALLIGEKSEFTPQFQTAVRSAGLSHVMVVSGMHLAIIMSGITAVLSRFCIRKLWRNLLYVTAVFLFMAICGFSISIQRAALTYILALFATVINRDNDSLNTLLAAVCFILAFTPYVLFNISFQLSVLSTMGILVILPMAERRLNKFIPKVKIIRECVTAFIGSIAALIITLPVIIWHFGSFSLASPVSNMLVSYAVTVDLLVTALALIVSLVLPFDIFVKPLFLISGILTDYINRVIYFFGSSSAVMVETSRNFALASVVLIAVVLIVKRIISRYQYFSQLEKIL